MACEQQMYQKVEDVAKILGSFAVQDVFLVVGPSSYKLSGAKKRLESILSSYTVTTFSDFVKNPTVEDLQRGIQMFQGSDASIVLAIGGGSVLDMGKSIALLAGQVDAAEEYITKVKKSVKRIPSSKIVSLQ